MPPDPIFNEDEFAADTDVSWLLELPDEELADLLRTHEELEERLTTEGPQNDDELHTWLIHELGINIPRTKVCEEHDAPFSFIADLFFERTEAALGVANRGGAKTFMVAVLHWLNSRFKPGCESCTFGAVENQSYRAYSHLKGWIYDDDGNKRPDVISTLQKETMFRNGSKIEVLGSTPEQVNGPHPQKAHADEIELMRDDTWQESRNMTISGKTRDGKIIIPQDIATSTRKGPNGRVQQLIDEIELAVAQGYKPPRKLYMWCIKETAAKVKNCRMAPENANLADCFKCPCNKIRKGSWDDENDPRRGQPRLLQDVCNGDFYKSGGWQPYQDIVKQFSENDRETFEAQVLCQKPEMKWHYVPNWNDAHHCIRGFVPDPYNGPIFMAVDWGGTNPHAINWYQLLRYEVEVLTWDQPESGPPSTKRLKEGTLVCFDEIYVAEIGNDKLADLVIQKEKKYETTFGFWRVFERYADPQGKAARMDWKEKNLRTTWHTTREFEEHIKDVKNIFEDDLFFVDGDKCQMFVKEIKAWRRDEKTGQQIDVFNHCMSEFRYTLANLKKVRKRALGSIAGHIPRARSIPRQSIQIRRTGEQPIGFSGRSAEIDRWRQNLGSPVTRQ